jgi:transposase-like protein
MFDCVILDESSILKNFDGAIKNQVTAFLKKVKYRFLYTATPSPNDYIELGTSSEALGYMGYMDMLSKFFKNNSNNVVKFNQAQKANMGLEWYLKPHAEKDFWRWISSWSISARKPSDLGFSDDLFVLPELTENKVFVKNKNPLDIDGQTQLFNFPATNFREIKAEVRSTINERCEKAVELSQDADTYVSWVNLNDEAKKIKEIDNSFIEICGNMDIDEKEDILLNFSKGNIKRLITKSSITAFGLNWQHCNKSSYFPTFSYEQYYQSIRRFWRFGQKRPVKIDLIMSDGQTKILDALIAKKEKAISMFKNLISQTNTQYTDNKKEFSKQIIKPTFLGAK